MNKLSKKIVLLIENNPNAANELMDKLEVEGMKTTIVESANDAFSLIEKQPFDFSLAMCEMAWTSFSKPAKIFTQSVLKERNKIHPTQKPIELYKWLLTHYAEKGQKILDTHLGGGSIAIACDELGFDLTACEIDKDYFDKANKRLKPYRNQQALF